jgi:hypothetical protein
MSIDENLNQYLEQRLDAKSALRTLFPITILGAVAMGYAQRITYEETQSLAAGIAAGLTAQTIVRSVSVLPSHALMNRARLKNENGGYRIGAYAQEMATIAASAKVLYAPWLASLTALDTYLSTKVSQFEAGFYASGITGAAYAVTLACFSPRILDGAHWVKDKVKKKLSSRTGMSD